MHKIQRITTAVAAVLVFVGIGYAASDEIIITHRSGKVQTIRIEQPGDPVEQVSFRRGKEESPTPQQQSAATPSAPQQQQKPVASQPSAPAAVKTPEPAQSSGGSGVKIKWAKPVDTNY